MRLRLALQGYLFVKSVLASTNIEYGAAQSASDACSYVTIFYDQPYELASAMGEISSSYTVCSGSAVSSGAPTSTTSPTATPTPTCDNQGLEWAYYGTAPYNSDPTVYSTYTTTIINGYKVTVPGANGTTSKLGGIDSSTDGIQIYDSSFYSTLEFWSLDHRFYLFAEVEGTYTITLPSPDDISLLWVGEFVNDGFTRENAEVVNPVGYAGTMTYNLDLEQGSYYPIRILFGQAEGAAIFYASITAPNGTVILDQNSGPSSFIVRYSCDGVSAPAYPAWGQES